MWEVLIPAATQVLGGIMGSKSRSEAGRIQAEAARYAADQTLQGTREANALISDMYRQGLMGQAPYMRGGQMALSALMSGLGLGPAYNPGAAMPGYNQVPGVGGNVAGGAGYAGGPAFVNDQGVMVDKDGKPITVDPNRLGYTNYGASNEEMAGLGMDPRFKGTFLEQFTGQDLYKDPSYEFRLTEGERLLRARQAAGGNRWSGQAMKDITAYGQDMASQEYQNAYNRFRQNKMDLYDRLSALAGVGGQTAGSVANQGMNAGGAMSQNITQGISAAQNYMTGGAAAQAGGLVGSTNAIVGGLQGGVNAGMNNWYARQWLDRFDQNNPRIGNLNPSNLTGTGYNPIGDGFYTNPQYGP